MDSNSVAIEVDDSRAVPVVRVRGDWQLDFDNYSRGRGAAIGHLMDECPRVILDLTGVTRLDSFGIGCLVTYMAHAVRLGRRLDIVAPPGQPRIALERARLDRVCRCYDQEEAALLDA